MKTIRTQSLSFAWLLLVLLAPISGPLVPVAQAQELSVPSGTNAFATVVLRLSAMGNTENYFAVPVLDLAAFSVVMNQENALADANGHLSSTSFLARESALVGVRLSFAESTDRSAYSTSFPVGSAFEVQSVETLDALDPSIVKITLRPLEKSAVKTLSLTFKHKGAPQSANEVLLSLNRFLGILN